MGGHCLEHQEIAAILLLFGRDLPQARVGYRKFIGDGIPLGRRKDLVWWCSKAEPGSRTGKRWWIVNCLTNGCWGVAYSSRVCNKMDNLRLRVKSLSLENLLSKLCEIKGLDPGDVSRPGKIKALAKARGIICYLAIRELAYKGVEVGRYLHLGSTGVTLATRRGEKELNNDPILKNKLLATLADQQKSR
jgi:putative transposase